MTEIEKQLETAIRYINEHFKTKADIAVILGSGLGNFTDLLENTISIPTESIPFYPKSTVEGHAGNLIFATLHSKPIIAVQGRSHYYEGYTINEVVFSIRLLALLGIKTLIVSNASGALNSDFKTGELMIIDDQINFSFRNPLIGSNIELIGDRFPDMSQPYSQRLIRIVKEAALRESIQLRHGVYLGLSGPSYETPAEVKMLQKLGADAVGMSTVPDVIAGIHANMEILGISCITNAAAGTFPIKLSHADVTKIAGENSAKFNRLISQFVKSI